MPGYPTGDNAATGLPWALATDGLRDITGRVNPNGTATIWAITSTVSGDGDEGADPNKLLAITDQLGATTLPSSESFATVRAAGSGEVLRGISFTPGTGASHGGHCQGAPPLLRRSLATDDPGRQARPPRIHSRLLVLRSSRAAARA